MGGQVRNKRRFKMRKSQKRGRKVNDSRTFYKKSKAPTWHSIKDIRDKLDKIELNDL